MNRLSRVLEGGVPIATFTYDGNGQRIKREEGGETTVYIGRYYEKNLTTRYDPTLGRFISPDPLVPGAGNPQAWDRYAYVLNNPLRYTDPSGFWHNDAEIAASESDFEDDVDAALDAWQLFSVASDESDAYHDQNPAPPIAANDPAPGSPGPADNPGRPRSGEGDDGDVLYVLEACSQGFLSCQGALAVAEAELRREQVDAAVRFFRDPRVKCAIAVLTEFVKAAPQLVGRPPIGQLNPIAVMKGCYGLVGR